MVDLQRQYRRIKPEVDTAIAAVLDNSAFINGQPVQDFARSLEQYLGIDHVIPCGNGTDALQIAMMALGLEPGDEVITPSFTFIATAEVIALLGLKPVFVDVDEQTYCLDIQQVEKAITSKTKAIVPVHLFGQSADMEPLMALARKHKLAVIEDNAQAIGGTYTFEDGSTKKTGTIGTIGCTSFFPSKNLGGYGDGGALFTDDEELAARIRMIANHGQSKRYYHDVVGCNSRLDTLQAAVLGIKLQHLDEYIAARRNAAAYYDKAFSSCDDIIIPYRAGNTLHVFHQYTIRVPADKRDSLRDYLATQGIPAMIYYPVPAHKQQMFAAFKAGKFTLPVTDFLAGEVLSLPMHTELDEAQLKYITDHVLQFMNA
ncbi:DegT/DnrJ/EryC1/StrS family aminotransferase [Compostibacter hankyongensis]|uniref:DegT/DnrJ/EryC1/StrS family aminotransferase n=2 Tax=Compostibacter hankyongensis TaxID=1007089 RepID=A0ABP8FI74_9BACT